MWGWAVLSWPGGLQCVRVELHGQRRLGHRDEALAQPRDVHVGVVRQRAGRGEQRLHALEQRAAGVSGELAVDESALLARGAVVAALQEAVAVRSVPVGDREAVQHRQAVEPVVQALLGHLELRRPGAQQRALQPPWQLTTHR
jgi:hypothetical protein